MPRLKDRLMTQVKFHFVLADGRPVSNTKFQLTLPKGAYQSRDSGVYVPTKIMGETDSEGKATLELEPLVRFPYTVVISDWKTGASIKHSFYVPESIEPVHLIDLVSVGTGDNDYDFKQETIDLINSAKADARTYREESAAAKDASVAASTQAGLHKDAAQRAELNAQSRAAEAGTYRDEANTTRTAMVLLKSDMDSVANTVNQDRTAITTMKTEINTKVLEVNSIITNELDPKIAQASQQLIALDSVRTELETKLVELDTKTQTIQNQFTWVGEQTTYIDSQIAGFDTNVTQHTTTINAAADTQLAAIQTEKDYIELTLKPQLETTRTNVESVYNEAVQLRDLLTLELNTVDEKILAVETVQGQLTGKLEGLDTKIATEVNPKVQQVATDAVKVAADKATTTQKVNEATTLVNDLAFDSQWVTTQKNYIEDRVTYFEGKVSKLSSQIGSVDAEVQYIQNQRAYFDNTLLPEINGLKAEIDGTVADVSGIKDDLFLLSTNGGAIFTKSWPTIDTKIDLTIDVLQESTHFVFIGNGGDVRFNFSGWHLLSTKYIVLIISNGGRGIIRWPSTVLWQSRDSAAPVFKENGIDTVILWCSPSHATVAGGPIIFGARVGR